MAFSGKEQQAIQVIVDGGGSNWEWIVVGVIVPLLTTALGLWWRGRHKKSE